MKRTLFLLVFLVAVTLLIIGSGWYRSYAVTPSEAAVGGKRDIVAEIDKTFADTTTIGDVPADLLPRFIDSTPIAQTNSRFADNGLFEGPDSPSQPTLPKIPALYTETIPGPPGIVGDDASAEQINATAGMSFAVRVSRTGQNGSAHISEIRQAAGKPMSIVQQAPSANAPVMTIYCQSIKTSHGSDEIAFFCDGDVFIVFRTSMLRGHDLQYKHGELQLTNAEILTTDSRIKAEACSLECVIGSICIEPISEPEVTGEDEIIDEWIERPADTAPAIAH